MNTVQSCLILTHIPLEPLIPGPGCMCDWNNVQCAKPVGASPEGDEEPAHQHAADWDSGGRPGGHGRVHTIYSPHVPHGTDWN